MLSPASGAYRMINDDGKLAPFTYGTRNDLEGKKADGSWCGTMAFLDHAASYHHRWCL